MGVRTQGRARRTSVSARRLAGFRPDAFRQTGGLPSRHVGGEGRVGASEVHDVDERDAGEDHRREDARVRTRQREAEEPPRAAGRDGLGVRQDGSARSRGGFRRLSRKASGRGRQDRRHARRQLGVRNADLDVEDGRGIREAQRLSALFGYVLKSEAATERFLLDWRNACSRLIEENYYAAIARLAHERGMSVQYETAFGDVIVGDLLRYWKYADEPMCEFWSPHDDARGFVGSHDFKPVLPCVSAAHVYGKKRVSAEALTSFELTFDENFTDWKKIVDRHFGRGVTHVVFHTYTHNPVANGKPPSTSFGGGIGSPFLRGQTWWPYLKEFTKYLAFCGHELERGKPVVDILMYLGDDVNHKPSERQLLFGNGYKYDYCNPDVLMTRLSAKDGRVVLPDGMSYRVLWIPEGTFLLPATEAKLAELAKAGARIVRGAFTPDWPSPVKSMTARDGKDVHWYQRREDDEDIFRSEERRVG